MCARRLLTSILAKACLALELTDVFPTFPERMAAADVSAGLVLPNAAVAMLGKGGAVASKSSLIYANKYCFATTDHCWPTALLLVFMAVTSASSAEFIAVSSIFTYDVYKTYWNPMAGGKMLINMAHSFVVLYAILLAAFSTGLYCEHNKPHSSDPR